MIIKIRIGLNTKIVRNVEQIIRNTIETDINHEKYFIWASQQKCFSSPLDLEVAYICIEGAEYLKQLILKEYSVPPTLNPISGSVADFYYLEGIYHIEMENNCESHACIISFRKHDVTIYTSYGGVIGFNITSYSKQEWVTALLAFDASNNATNQADYFTLWGIRPDPEFARRFIDPAHFFEPVKIESLIYTRLY